MWLSLLVLHISGRKKDALFAFEFMEMNGMKHKCMDFKTSFWHQMNLELSVSVNFSKLSWIKQADSLSMLRTRIKNKKNSTGV